MRAQNGTYHVRRKGGDVAVYRALENTDRPNRFAASCVDCESFVTAEAGLLIRLAKLSDGEPRFGTLCRSDGCTTRFAEALATKAETDDEAGGDDHQDDHQDDGPRQGDLLSTADADERNVRQLKKDARRRCKQHRHDTRWLDMATRGELVTYLTTGTLPERANGAAARQDPPSGDAAAQLGALLGQLANVDARVDAAVDARVKPLAERIAKELANRDDARPRIFVNLPSEEHPIEVKGVTHKLFAEVLEAITHLKTRAVYLQGPAGSGKGTLARQLAEALKLEFGALTLTQGLAESHLLGRLLADGRYVPAPFVVRYEGSGVFLLDEIDRSDPNMLCSINDAIAANRLWLPNRIDNPEAIRHERNFILAAGNTFGDGYSAEFSGAVQLDGASLDRYVGGQFRLGFDRDVERAIAMAYGDNKDLLTALWKMRRNTESAQIRRTVGTRAIENLSALRRSDPGKWTVKALVERLTVTWTDEERAKAVEGVAL